MALQSNKHNQAADFNIAELEKLDIPQLLAALSLSEKDLQNLSIKELNKKYKEKGISKSKTILKKLRNRRRQFKSRIDARNKRDREKAEEAMLREGLNQVQEALANSPCEEEMAQIRDRTEFFKQECEFFEATGRMRYCYYDYSI